MQQGIRRFGIVDAPGRPFMSLAIAAGGRLTACHTATDRTTDAADQARQILRALESHLLEAGSDRSRLLAVQVWLRNPADVDSVVAVWNAWIPSHAAPACSVVVSALARPDILVEIKVTAAC